MIPFFLVLLLPSLILSQHTPDKVIGLIPQYSHPWYSGFLNVSSQKSLHYVFFQSQHDHLNDPLLVWLGSQLGYSTLNSMVYQNGPFHFHLNDTSHSINNHSWNKQANLLYIETLPSVGFSIGQGSNTEENVAKGTLTALIDFLSKYPMLRNNKLYLAGSGYAGTLAAYLANQTLEYNNHHATLIRINLQGLLLGNPCIHHSECFDVGVDSISYRGYQFLYKHGFYSEEQFDEVKSACSWDFSSTGCYQVRTRFQKTFKQTNTSLTHIYHPCFYQKDHYGDLRCQDTKGADNFFNTPDTQIKLHVFETKRDWKVYNHEVAYKYKGNQNGSYHLLATLMKYYKVWIYSGDVSGVVPLKGTLDWLEKFREEVHLPVMEPWREWWTKGLHVHEDQVAGMVWKLKNLTLVTVRAGGFYAARNRPQALEEVVGSYLSGGDLPRKGEL